MNTFHYTYKTRNNYLFTQVMQQATFHSFYRTSRIESMTTCSPMTVTNTCGLDLTFVYCFHNINILSKRCCIQTLIIGTLGIPLWCNVIIKEEVKRKPRYIGFHTTGIITLTSIQIMKKIVKQL